MNNANGILLTPRDGQTFRFDAGTLCLEFLLTGALPEWEQLHAPEDLAAWIPLSRLGLPDEVVVGEADLAEAKRLRAAIQALAERATGVGDSADPEGALAVLNEFAAAPPPVPVVTPSFQRGWATPVTGAQFLSAVARDAVELFGGPMASRVRVCGGERCLLIFLDTSRPGARRWCSMDRCGNRYKLRTRRDRAPRPADAGH
ncbi:CGNR zinc finger domain-containing protein [Streptosporangium sandarakinum]|uniref:Putative RNA-binding Zn ribbon-like protein n=1 Tax=Streptosporangium sandarakinum TaxID=1260955 RepID=A0A852UXJ8_9ACTN|nr:CGNR zinc finger domain-containing protein [Streptosporangium sandarakinum]NYF40218.1 putative RNA-binding Zn ribbon-like protein [Streptosporangium sandarakinum]